MSVDFTSAKDRTSSAMGSAPAVLNVQGFDVERFGLLGRMAMLGPGIDIEIAELLLAQRALRQHALNRLFDDALRMLPVEDLADDALFDAAGITRVIVEDLFVD